MHQHTRVIVASLCAAGIAAFVHSASAHQARIDGTAPVAGETAIAEPDAPTRFEMPECDAPTGPSAPAGSTPLGSPEARAAAQSGLDFLARETVAWQDRHACFGCHVHTVTLEAFTVARSHYYEVNTEVYDSVLTDMLDLPGGGRTESGFSYHGSSLFQPSQASGGAALARYDELIGTDLGDELVRAAAQLLEYQRPDGSIDLQYSNGRVFVGDVQGTALAIRTWQQAFARTADPGWNTAVQNAERYLRDLGTFWTGTGAGEAAPLTQDINYAIIGMTAAGVGPNEDAVARLRVLLLDRQNPDGGFSQQARQPQSDILVTGQSVFALRSLGLTDRDPPVEGGMGFLMEAQAPSGGWSANGASKAEAMWAILGLVTLDALTIEVDGIADGERVDGVERVAISVTDNQGGTVVRTRVLVDDVPVAGECGDQLEWRWDTQSLASGPHTVDVLATNARGVESRRRFTLYAGDVFLTRIGTRFEDGGMRFSMRNIGPSAQDGEVDVEVFTVGDDGGAPVAGSRLWSTTATGAQGATQFFWDGTSEQSGSVTTASRGRHMLRVSYRANGRVVQSEETLFFNGTAEQMRGAYGAVSGQLALESGEGATNAMIELVDNDGRVIQSTTSTASGNYRFDNLDEGEYNVRVRRSGFAPSSSRVQAAPSAAPSEVNIELQVE